MSAISCFVVVVFIVAVAVQGRMQPAENVFPKIVNDARMQIERSTLEDCHLRYHKYGDYFLEYPIYGVPAKSKEFAHMAALGWTQSDGKIVYACGGSLISPNYVLTAAHCSRFNGTEPDTVRIGDINLFSSLDDDIVQVFGVAEIIKHPEYKFSSSYNDIALIRLSNAIVPTDAVTPACLWTEKNVDFARMEATGWGLTGFGEKPTDILLKVELSPLASKDCNEYYGIGIYPNVKAGILDSQICALDEKMDTCQGDSGGPLQIKLLANERMTPFVVGITSFGPACGLGTPGVYTRVSEYITWIESIVRIPFRMTDCAARGINNRDFSPDLTAQKVEDSLLIEPERGHVSIERYPKHRAFIGWKVGKMIDWLCSGSLVTENYILTSARCVNRQSKPDIAKVGALRKNQQPNYNSDVQKISIADVLIHPQYNGNSRENNMALVKLVHDVRLTRYVLPACLWTDPKNTAKAFELGAIGPEYLNRFYTDETNELDGVVAADFSSELTFLRVRVNPVDKEKCSQSILNATGERVHNHEFCAGSPMHMIPGICEMYPGGSVERETWHYDKYFPYVMGINSYGTNCGFGSPAVFTKIAPYVDWMERAIYGDLVPRNSIFKKDLHFVDDDYKPGESCTAYNSTGLCVALDRCPQIVDLFKREKVNLKLCSAENGGSICCPTKFILDDDHKVVPQGGQVTPQLNQCHKENVNFRVRGDNYIHLNEIGSEGRPATTVEIPHAVAIAISGNGYNIELSCAGAYIGHNFVLTSASCIGAQRLLPNIVRLGSSMVSLNVRDTSAKVQEFIITSVFNHPHYNQHGNQEHDIALLKFEGKVVINSNVVPACLWSNKTFTPFNLQSYGYSNWGSRAKQLTIRPRNPLFQDQCRKFYPRVCNRQMCVENYYTTNDVCADRSGDILQYVEVKDTINYPLIVGITSFAGNCKNSPMVVTRIPEHIPWIEYILSLDKQFH